MSEKAAFSQDIINKGDGRTGIRMQLMDTGDGLCVCLTGGEAPHVGGAVLASPRPSLTGQGESCDLWIVTAPGHKDVYLAQKIAGRLCASLGVNVSVTAGIHIDGAKPEELKLIEEHALSAAEEYLERMAERGNGEETNYRR